MFLKTLRLNFPQKNRLVVFVLIAFYPPPHCTVFNLHSDAHLLKKKVQSLTSGSFYLLIFDEYLNVNVRIYPK